jgi:hypothetical protein
MPAVDTVATLGLCTAVDIAAMLPLCTAVDIEAKLGLCTAVDIEAPLAVCTEAGCSLAGTAGMQVAVAAAWLADSIALFPLRTDRCSGKPITNKTTTSSSEKKSFN